MISELATICKEYVSAPIVSHTKLNRGKINETFLLSLEDGNKYILQRIKLMPVFDRKVSRFHEVAEAWMRNYKTVSKALAGEGYVSGRPLRIQNDGNYVFRSQDKSLWRMFRHIDNDEVGMVDENIAYNAGKALGSFHRLLKEKEYKPIFPLPDFHNTPKVIGQLEKIFLKHKDKADQIRAEYLFLKNKTKEYYLPADLSAAVIHGDPKLNNFLFKNGKVRGLIDLDSMMVGNIYLDIGDALRSWCNDRNIFNKEIFYASLDGYQEGLGKRIDLDLALRSAKLITLELAARYLIDYFEERYFSWEPESFKSAAEHNLARARSGIVYFHSIQA